MSANQAATFILLQESTSCSIRRAVYTFQAQIASLFQIASWPMLSKPPAEVKLTLKRVKKRLGTSTVMITLDNFWHPLGIYPKTGPA